MSVPPAVAGGTDSPQPNTLKISTIDRNFSARPQFISIANWREAITALLAKREPVVIETDRELAELVAVARELQGLPSEQFRAALKDQLGDNMSTAPKSKSKKFKREGFHTVTPYLIVKPAVELVDFVKEAFGAVESFRSTGSAGGLHCEVKIGDSVVMIGGGPTFETRPAAIHLYVSDVDEVYARAVAAGATSLAEPSDQEYGERVAGVKDIGGNEWYIARRMDPTPIQDLHTVAVYFHPVGAPKFIDFLEKAFDAEVVERHQSNEGHVYHSKVRLGDSIVVLLCATSVSSVSLWLRCCQPQRHRGHRGCTERISIRT